MTYPQNIPLKARVSEKTIQIWWSGKWRTVRYYQGKGTPSTKIQKQALTTFKLAAGLAVTQECTLNWEV